MATYWENSCSFGLRYVSWYKYLIVSLVFSHLGFWSGNLFLIAPFPDLCLLVPFYLSYYMAFNQILFNYQTTFSWHSIGTVFISLRVLAVEIVSNFVGIPPSLFGDVSLIEKISLISIQQNI